MRNIFKTLNLKMNLNMSTQMTGFPSDWVMGSPIMEFLKCTWGIVYFASRQSQLTPSSVMPQSVTLLLPKIPKDLFEKNLGA